MTEGAFGRFIVYDRLKSDDRILPSNFDIKAALSFETDDVSRNANS